MAGVVVPRDRYGRPLVVPPGGGRPIPYTRVTRYVSALEDSYNLSKWQQRMVAVGLADRPDLLLAASAHRDDKTHLDQITDKAQEAATAGAAATTGTAIHALTERMDRGEPLPALNPTHLADLMAYQAGTAGLDMAEIEIFLVNDDLRVGGTTDRIVVRKGRRYIADLKTGQIEYGIGKIAMQLATYAHSLAYDPDTGARREIDVDAHNGIIIHLPAGQGRCDLYWVDLAEGWRGVQIAAQVREWRRLKILDLTVPFAA